MIEGIRLNPLLIGKVNEVVEYQGIGGNEIIIEREFNVSDLLDVPFNEMNLACINFITRIGYFKGDIEENIKVYYGKVDGLGYLVYEDELEWIKEYKEGQ